MVKKLDVNELGKMKIQFLDVIELDKNKEEGIIIPNVKIIKASIEPIVFNNKKIRFRDSTGIVWIKHLSSVIMDKFCHDFEMKEEELKIDNNIAVDINNYNNDDEDKEVNWQELINQINQIEQIEENKKRRRRFRYGY